MKKQSYTTQFYFKNNITYAAIPKQYLQNKELSLKAKGLLTIIYTLPDEWKYNMKGLQKIANLTEKTLRKLLEEIMQQGYIHRSKQQDKKGRFYYTYLVFPEQVENNIWI